MDNLKNVLVPTDFSPTAWQAVLAGIKMAKNVGAPVNLIHVTPIDSDDKYTEELQTKLQNIAENLSSIYNVKVNSIVKKGETRNVIENCISKLKVDMVVMGLNGTGGNEIGSLTGYVMHHLNCPVTVVPGSSAEFVTA